LVVVADGAVVAVDADAGGVDVAAVVETAVAVVLGSFCRHGNTSFSYSADGSRNIPFITLTAYG